LDEIKKLLEEEEQQQQAEPIANDENLSSEE
jgi:hypothetical protein